MRATLKSLAIESVRFVSNVRVSVEDDLDELVASVQTFGVLQPITVRRDGKGYRVLYGHRRLAAARRAGLKTVPALVESFSDDEIVARQIVENLQRKDLSLTEQSKAVRLLYDEHGIASLVGEMIGKKASWVSKMLLLTAVGKSSVAQRLMASDRLTDLESAYILCRIEAIDKDAAAACFPADAGTPSRSALRTRLEQLEAAQRGDGDDDDDLQGDEAAAGGANMPKAYTLTLTAQEAAMLHVALSQAVAAPDLANVRISLLNRLAGIRP